MKKQILKSYFGEIFFEFIVHNDKRDAIILLPGFPSSNIMDDVIYFLYEKGFNVFVPRYKGTFQSKGQFLKSNPLIDLSNFINYLKKGKTLNLWDMKDTLFKIRSIYLFGGSFGASIACGLIAISKDIKKAVICTPVFDYASHNKDFKEQDLRQLTKFVSRAYKNLYRYKFKDLVEEMKKFNQFSLQFYKKNIKKPLLILHDSNDHSISIEHSRAAVRSIKNSELIETNTGHGLSIKLLNKYYPQIYNFLKD